jgi:tRNA 2-thiouridine synthesizing protein E
MPEIMVAGSPLNVTDEGYLTDPDSWSEEIASGLAKEAGIELTDKHFEVLNYLRSQYQAGTPLTIRRIGKSGLVSIKEFYALFPGGPLKVSSRLAGIPKPASCV